MKDVLGSLDNGVGTNTEVVRRLWTNCTRQTSTEQDDGFRPLGQEEDWRMRILGIDGGIMETGLTFGRAMGSLLSLEATGARVLEMSPKHNTTEERWRT